MKACIGSFPYGHSSAEVLILAAPSYCRFAPNVPTHSASRQENRAAGALSVRAIALALLLLPSVAAGRVASQAGPSQSLGSLSTVGDVYVNDSRAPAESTIFVGDLLLTGENGVASFTASGKGTLKIAPHSVAVFAGTEKYVAELKLGSLVMSSPSGSSGFSLRVADFLLVPAVQQQQTTAKVDKMPDDSFLLSCLEGSVSVISLQGGSGLLLQTGQSATISPSGELSSNTATSGATLAPGPTPPTQTQPGTPPTAPSNHRKQWIILGVAGGAAAGIAAAAAGGGGGHHPVSPSSP